MASATTLARHSDHRLGSRLTLTGARVALSASHAEILDVLIDGDRIASITPPSRHASNAPTIDLSGYLMLPGLINAHDHLEFNLFPRLGDPPYRNAIEWAHDIYQPQHPPIASHLHVPKPIRILWGALKNLLSGVTTVAHHNPPPAHPLPVRVVNCFGWGHSLSFSPSLVEDHRDTPSNWPFLLHAAEGVDLAASQEIDTLHRLGILTPNTVLVHGVAATPHQIDLLQDTGTALVWCPRSNHFLFGQSLPPEVFDSSIPIALGSDSALTSGGDLLDELATARATNHVDLDRLYRMVTSAAARILRLDTGFGEITAGGPADLILVPCRHQTPVDALFAKRSPDAVLIAGQLRCFSNPIASRLTPLLDRPFQRITLQHRGTRWVDAPVSQMLHSTTGALDAIYCGGKRVS